MECPACNVRSQIRSCVQGFWCTFSLACPKFPSRTGGEQTNFHLCLEVFRSALRVNDRIFRQFLFAGNLITKRQQTCFTASEFSCEVLNTVLEPLQSPRMSTFFEILVADNTHRNTLEMLSFSGGPNNHCPHLETGTAGLL